MPESPRPNTIFCRRLKAAGKAAGLSQKQLGIQAGLDEFVASTRINRYELGVHEPDLLIARRLAQILQVHLAYFYAEDDRLARLIRGFPSLTEADQEDLLTKLPAETYT